jgi:hypothetical protein
MTNIIITITLFYIVIRYFGPLLKDYLLEKITGTKRKPETDFDALIKRKEEMLRRGMNAPVEEASAGSYNKRKFKTKTHELYYLASTQSSKDGDNQKEYTKVLELLDNCDWGEGSIINSIGTTVSSKLSKRLESSEITPYILNIIKREVLLNLKSENLPTFVEVKSVCESKVYLENLLREIKNGGGAYTEKMAKLNRVTERTLILSFSYLIYREIKSQSKKMLENFITAESPLKYINLLKPIELESGINKFILTGDQKKFRNISAIIKLINDQVLLMNALLPISPLKGNNDLSGALNIIMIDGNLTKENVKKAYKKLAAIKHPDKLSSRSLSKELEQVATTNFIIIQSAYDIILKSIKE